MRIAYPVIFTPSSDGGYTTFIPDFDVGTQGSDVADAIKMTRDLLGVMGIDMQDDGDEIPQPFSKGRPEIETDDFVSLVDIDFDEYRRAHDMRTVRRNVSLPSWLNVEAEKAGLNVSAVLQDALKNELNIK